MENPAPEDATWQVSKVPPGSTIDRGMCAEKRRNDRPVKVGTLNSGGPEPIHGRIRSKVARRDRRQGDAAGRFRESDPPIVVRDGRTDYMAKGWAEGQGKQSTHARERNTPDQSVSRSLLATGARGVSIRRARKSDARLFEEPGAVVPHAGICEGGTG
jgi:hypothetical protein